MNPPVVRALQTLFTAVAAVPMGIAAAAIVGLGVTRNLDPLAVSIAATVLIGLPIAGVWALGGKNQTALLLGMVGWPALFLLGLPGFFPGEAANAIGTGFAVLAAPGGTGASRQAGRLGDSLSTPIHALPQGTLPPEMAGPPPPECPPPSIVENGDQVALPYEGQAHSLAIPVQFGEVDVPMLFDTGATLTTLSSDALRRIGARVTADAPEVTLRTANGPRKTRLVLVDQVWLGGFPVEGVTVGVCDECADTKVDGLLGLNVSGQFLVTLDTARKEVVLQQRGVAMDRLVDVGPWLDVQARAAIYPDQRVEVEVEAHNRAPRTVRTARVTISCGDDPFVVNLADIAPYATVTKKASLPRGTDCEVYKVSLEGATW